MTDPFYDKILLKTISNLEREKGIALGPYGFSLRPFAELILGDSITMVPVIPV
jgi:hypothetical protein